MPISTLSCATISRRQLGAKLDYVCPTHTYDRRVLEQRVPSGPVLLIAAGTSAIDGPHTKGFREKVVADLPDRKIVQMPQTMDFQRVNPSSPGFGSFTRPNPT